MKPNGFRYWISQADLNGEPAVITLKADIERVVAERDELTVERDALAAACRELVDQLHSWAEGGECDNIGNPCEICQQGEIVEINDGDMPSGCDTCGYECGCNACSDLRAIMVGQAALALVDTKEAA